MNKDVVHIYNGILLSHKKNKMMSFAATWLDLEIIILSEVSQTKKYHMISLMLLLLLLSCFSRVQLFATSGLQPAPLSMGFSRQEYWSGFLCPPHRMCCMNTIEHCMHCMLSCVQLCDPMDCSLPGSSVCGTTPARIVEWVAISSCGDLPNSEQTCIPCGSCIGRRILYL